MRGTRTPNLALATTLAHHLSSQVRERGISGRLAAVITQVAATTKRISAAVGKGELAGILGSAGAENIQGEVQKKLDVISNEMMVDGLSWTGHLRGLASEEMDRCLPLDCNEPDGAFLALFDPLDGSTNIDINASIGTIFSILPAPAGPVTDQSFLQPGRAQVAAGYALYGPSTQLVLTTGHGVTAFTLDRERGEYVLTHASLSVPADTSEYAINASNQRFWEAPVQRYISECQQGSDGPRGRDFNMRWNGSMVGDVHRVLSRGGIFLYPRDHKKPPKAGRLRLLYEANPMAFLAEQAGGAATDSIRALLDIEPTDLHQRVPVILGSRNEVALVADYHRSA